MYVCMYICMYVSLLYSVCVMRLRKTFLLRTVSSKNDITILKHWLAKSIKLYFMSKLVYIDITICIYFHTSR